MVGGKVVFIIVAFILIISFSKVSAIENDIADGFENGKSVEGNNIELSPNELLNLEIQEIINPKKPYVLDFISEDLIPTQKIDNKLEAKKQEFLLNKLNPIVNLSLKNYTYGFIMINGRITKEKLQNVKEAGIELLNFHSAHTYTAKIPFDRIDALNNIAFVRWIGYSTLKQKLDSHLFEFLEVNNDEIILNQNRSKDLVDVSVFLFEKDNATQVLKEIGGKSVSVYNNSGHFGEILEQNGAAIIDYDSELKSYRIITTPEILKEIIKLDFIIFIEKNRKGKTMLDESTPAIGADYIRSSYNGNGISVGTIDSGYESDHDDLPVATYGIDYVGSDPYTDTTGHGTYVAGILLGRGTANSKYKGVANGVTNISIAKIVQSDSTYEEVNLRSAMDWMASSPTTEIVSVSLGNHTDVAFNGSDQTSAKLDNKVYNDNEIYIVSAGNVGVTYTIGIPGVAKNAITVGAVTDFGTNTDNIWDGVGEGSSRGPTGEGRYKPDVVAPGCNIDSTNYQNNNSYGPPPNTPTCGTSWAAPHVSGLIATLLQHYSDFKNDQQKAARVKALLTATALAHGGNPSNNGNTYGMGKVDAYLSHYNRNNTNGWYWGTIACNVTSTGCCGGNITVPSGASRLVVTLVWHEPASAPGSGAVVLNDVDLIVDKDGNEASCGSGEYFSNSAIDNKENVTVENPAAGLYALKFYPFSVQAPLDPQPVRAAYMVIRGDPTPTTTVTISANDTSVIVGEQFKVTATASPSSYVASGVYTKINLPNGLDVVSMNTTRKDGTIANYSSGFVALNLGDIYESDSRSITWVLNATTSGGKRINVSIDSDNGGVDDDVITIGVSSPEEASGDIPLISIITPTDGGTYATNSVNLDWTSNETLATCYFRLDDGFYNQSICQFNYSYSGFSFSVGAQDSSPQDVTVKGNYFYVVGITNEAIYEYDSSGTYTGFNFFVGNQEISPQGITWNGSRFYVVGLATDKVYEYDLTGVYTGFNFSVTNQDTNPTGVTRRGNKFLITGDSTNRVYEYDISGTYTGFNFSVANEQTDPEGIIWDGVSFYIVDSITDRIYGYSGSGNYTGFNFSVGGQDTTVTGIAFNGSSIVISGNTNNKIFKYNLQNNVATNTTLNSLVAGKHNVTIVGKNLDGGVGQSGYSYFNITSPDTIKPRINASLNNLPSDFLQGNRVNMTANVSDDIGLSFCQFIDNQSLPNGAKQLINKTVTGTNDQCSQNYTISLAAGGVINFTVIVNDTSNNINQSHQIITVLASPSLKIDSLTEIYSNETIRIFEFVITNNGSGAITNVQWWFDTNNSYIINSTINISSLAAGESAFVYLEYNFSSTGSFNTKANASNGSLSDMKTFIVNISTAPVITAIPDITFNEDAYNDSLNLSNYVSDAEDPDSALTWTASNNVNVIVTINQTTKIANFTALANWSGSENIKFTVNDTSGLTANDTILATVNPVNDAPTFNSSKQIPNMTWPEDISNNSLNISTYFYDIDGDALNYTSTGTTNLIVHINNNTGIVNLTPNANWTGIDYVVFIAKDPSGSTASSNNVTLNVTPVNDAPTFTGVIPQWKWPEDVTNLSLNLTQYFSDIDGDQLKYNFTSVTNITISINNNTGIVNFTSDLNFNGVRYVIFTAIDALNITMSSNNVTLNVTPVNDPPTIDSYVPLNLKPSIVAGSNLTFNHTSSDVDGDALSYSWKLDWIGKSTEQGWVYSPTTNELGTHNVTLNVSDGTVNVSMQWNVTVINQTNINVYDFSVLHQNSTLMVFGFSVNNTGTVNLTNINWSLNTGPENIFANELFGLKPNESIFVFVEYAYPTTGDYTAIASATDGTYSDSESLAIEIEDIEVNNLSVVYANATERIFEVIIKNFLNTNLTNVSWIFDTKNSNVINSTITTTLQPNEEMFVYIDYNFTSTGTFNVNASAKNGTLIDSRNLTITI